MHEVGVAEVVVAEDVAAAEVDAACHEAAVAHLRSADPAAAVRLPLDRTHGLHRVGRTAADHLRSADPAVAAADEHLRTADPAVAAAPDRPNGQRTARVAVVASTVQVVRVVWAIVRVAVRATVPHPAI